MLEKFFIFWKCILGGGIVLCLIACLLLFPAESSFTSSNIWGNPGFLFSCVFLGLLCCHFYQCLKKKGRALKASEEHFHYLYENAQVGMITIDPGHDRVVMANSKLVKMLGYDPGTDLSAIPASGVCADHAGYEDLLNRLKLFQTVEAHPCKLKDRYGQILNLEVFARISESGLIEANLIDVGDKLSAENMLKYQAYLLETIPESVIAIDGFCRVVYQNRKAKESYGLLENRKYSLSKLINKLGFDENILRSLKFHLDRGDAWQSEQQINVCGQAKTFLHRLDRWTSDQNETSYVLVSTDISDLVESREQADIANLTKTQFLANISHEMRTPMIGILGSVNLLEQSGPTPEQSDNINIIRECGEHLLGIISQVLDVSNLELGLDSLYREPVYLTRVIMELIEFIQPLAYEKGLSIKLDIDSISGITCITDEVKLRQILMNIFHNALKFTDNGSINVHAHLEPRDSDRSTLLISVADTGIGIAGDKIPTVFEPFTQADGSFSRTFGGTGLGLYICQKLINLMEGEIWLNSQPGQGSVFHLSLPVEITSASLPASDRTDDSRPSKVSDSLLDFAPLRVLVVEDNLINQRIVVQMLNTYGFEVSTAGHGLDCLRVMHTRQFDVVLMDMQMPIMDGYEAALHISQDPELNLTPVVAMTAHAMSGDREKCLQSGCVDYIAKPFRAEELVDVIHRNLRKPESAGSVSDKHADQLLADLLPEFLDSLTDMIQELYQALDKLDAAAIQNTSHDIKGSAGLYGLNNISHLAALIEQAAKDGMIQKARILSGSLYSAYEDLQNKQVG